MSNCTLDAGRIFLSFNPRRFIAFTITSGHRLLMSGAIRTAGEKGMILPHHAGDAADFHGLNVVGAL